MRVSGRLPMAGEATACVGATAHARSHQRSSPPRSWRAGQRTGNLFFWVSKCIFKFTNNCYLLSACYVLLCYIRVENPP